MPGRVVRLLRRCHKPGSNPVEISPESGDWKCLQVRQIVVAVGDFILSSFATGSTNQATNWRKGNQAMKDQRAPAVLLQNGSASARSFAMSAVQVRLSNGCRMIHGIGKTGAANLGSRETISSRRALTGLDSGRQPLLDSDGDGNRNLLDIEAPAPGAFSRKLVSRWMLAPRGRISPRMRRGSTYRPATRDRWRSFRRAAIR